MIKIVTDTDASLGRDSAGKLEIELVPIHIIAGDTVLREYFDISPAEGYELLSKSEEFPTTSQPPVGEFKTVYEEILTDDPDAIIISIHVSGGVSGTIESARQAAALFPDADIRLFDSRTFSVAQGLMAQHAASLAERGAELDEILEHLTIMRDTNQIYFAVNTLEYLAKGGRIGRAAHLMGNMLELKPILTLKDGTIDAHSRPRTWKKATGLLEKMLFDDLAGPAQSDNGRLLIGIAHAVAEGEANQLASRVRERIKPEMLLISEIGPGLGIHVGPGALGITWVRVPPCTTCKEQAS